MIMIICTHEVMNEANSNVYSKVYDLSLGLCGSRRGQSNLYATEQ